VGELEVYLAWMQVSTRFEFAGVAWLHMMLT
jgi:hypothetical protein